jgi:hypothetical protein
MIASMSQRAPDAKPRKAGEIAVQVLMLLVLVAAALVVLRSLGPGGSPAKEAPQPVEQSKSRFEGRLLDSAGGGVAGASVEAVVQSGDAGEPHVLKFGPTGADGSFQFEWDASAGTVVSAVRASRGHLHAFGPISPGSTGVILRLPATFRVSGRVMAAEDGRPLEGMDVKLGERAAKTDDRGRFAFGEVPGDAVLPEIEVTGAGRKPLRRALPAEGGLDDLHLSVEGE